MITDAKIENFLLLAERKNFSAVAASAHISQQALSAQIASLEADMGFALFIRNTKHVELTDAGAQVQALCMETLQRFRDIQKRYSIQERCLLRIAFFEDMNLSGPIQAAMEQLKAVYPKIECQFTTRALFGEIDAGLEQDHFDIAVVPSGHISIRSIFQSESLYSSTLYGYISKEHPCAKTGMTLEDGKELPFFVGTDENSARATITSLCVSQGFRPSFYSPGQPPSIERMMVEMGRGIGFGDEFSTLHSSDRLLRFPVCTLDPSIVAIWKKAQSSPVIRDFIAMLRTVMNQSVLNNSKGT